MATVRAAPDPSPSPWLQAAVALARRCILMASPSPVCDLSPLFHLLYGEARTSASADPFLIPQFENGSERKGRAVACVLTMSS
jgi:hypothetical protein